MRRLIRRIAREIRFAEVVELAFIAAYATWRAFTAIGMNHTPVLLLSAGAAGVTAWQLLRRLPHTRPFHRPDSTPEGS